MNYSTKPTTNLFIRILFTGKCNMEKDGSESEKDEY